MADEKPSPGAPYVGRFAPSPSGPLHAGSLVSALASYLDARACGGRWLVRMEDIDPPREEPGAAQRILDALLAHGLNWDGEVLWQSRRSEAYLATLARLRAEDLLYPCNCTRRQLAASGGIYNGHCRRRPPGGGPVALRLKLYDLPGDYARLPTEVVFTDLVQGEQRQDLARDVGDAVVRRKDGLFAYQLAVVVDDIASGITHIVRGSDLLEVTARQIRLFELLDAPVPAYAHVPVVTDSAGRKLSKQNHAPALDPDRAGENLWQALVFLGQNPPRTLRTAARGEILDWGVHHWRRHALTDLRAPVPRQ